MWYDSFVRDLAYEYVGPIVVYKEIIIGISDV